MNRSALPINRPLPIDRPLPVRSVGLPGRSSPPRPGSNAVLVARADITPEIARFVIRPDDGPPAFQPGQYLTLGLVVDGAFVQRPYSTSSAPGARDLEFLVRRVPGGAFTPTLWQLAVGGRIRIGPAKGRFTLAPGDERTHLFVATGTGLAPFVSMLRSLSQFPDRPQAVVVHGVAWAPELAYRDHLSQLARDPRIHYLPVVSRPNDPASAGWSGQVGRVTDAIGLLHRAAVFEPAITVAYVCGSPAVIDSTAELLVGLGVPPAAVISERYWTS